MRQARQALPEQRVPQDYRVLLDLPELKVTLGLLVQRVLSARKD